MHCFIVSLPIKHAVFGPYMPRPLVATIHLCAMRNNLALAKAAAPGAKVWAVVKANAYGHGLLNAMRAFDAADGLAMIEPENALRVREAGWTRPVILLEGCFDQEDWRSAATNRIHTVVHTVEQIELLEAVRLRHAVNIYLKLNSGMNRLGFRPSAFRDAYARLRALSCVGDIDFMTHFANADEPANQIVPMSEQARAFEEATRGLPGLRSLSNSAADLMHPSVSADWVRPGVMLYGGSPSASPARDFGLRAAMTFSSKVIGVQHLASGDAVGYGSAFVATAPMRVAIIACGYADGYPRHAPTGTPLMVTGRQTHTLGRVSMDMLAADITHIPEAGVGSPVELWGNGVPIDAVAKAAGTIGYELMCAISSRVRMEVDDSA